MNLPNRLYSGLLSTLLACAPGPADPDAGTPDGGLVTGLAVLSSDYQVTTISLVDPVSLELVRENCIDSAFTAPGLSQALTGDVVLPTAPQPDGELLLIDHANAALTWVDPATCTPKRQRSVGAGAALNPHDAIALPDGRLYVTRYNPNPLPDADPSKLDDGDDVLVLDPREGTLLARIALPRDELLDGPVVYARPERGVLAGGKVWVTLGRQSGDHATSLGGRVVAIDPATDTIVETVDLSPLKVCGGIEADSQGFLVVACGGSFVAEDQSAESGVAFIDTTSSPPTVTVRVAKALLAGRPVNFGFATWLADGRAVVGSVGSLSTPSVPDALWELRSAGTAGKRLDSTNAFEVGRAAFHAGTGRLFVPIGDAANPHLSVLHEDGSSVGTLDVTPTSRLPPREVAHF